MRKNARNSSTGSLVERKSWPNDSSGGRRPVYCQLWVLEWTITPGARRGLPARWKPGRLQVGQNEDHAFEMLSGQRGKSVLVCLKCLWQYTLTSVTSCFMLYPSQNFICLGKGSKSTTNSVFNQFKHTLGKIKEYIHVWILTKLNICDSWKKNTWERLGGLSFETFAPD